MIRLDDLHARSPNKEQQAIGSGTVELITEVSDKAAPLTDA